MEQLQAAMLRLETARAPGRRANTSFGTFASRDFARTLAAKEATLCGLVDLAATLPPAAVEAATPVITDLQGLREIHARLMV